MAPPNPSARPFIRQRATGPFWYAKWSRTGEPVIRALGRAWVDSDGNGGWRRRRGRSPNGALTEAEAAARMLALVRAHDAEQTLLERDAEERRRRGVSFRALAADYLRWLDDVKGAKPSTLRDHRCLLAEPGQAYRRGRGSSPGLIMAALGERPAREVTTREVEELLRTIAATGVAPRTVNKARQLICAIFNYGMRPSTYALAANPAQHADRRREPDAAALAFYSFEQVEALAQALSAGAHRDPSRPAVGDAEAIARACDDAQDADLVRVAACAGLRRGEIVALRWRDVDVAGQKIIVRRALSGETEVRSTKSRRAREVPLPDQAAAALQRLRCRGEFIGPDDYVFANRLGRRLDPSALRRRYERARDAAGLEPLRFHDLRHTYGSLLVAGGIDLPSVKAAMGHARISTTERYLHARPASELAGRFTRACRVFPLRRVNDEPVARTTDPDGREVVYDDGTREHIERRRPDLIDQMDAIIGAVSLPDHREDDPFSGRERFYRRNILSPRRWLRVVVDFNESPARIVTALIQEHDPRKRR